MVVHQYVETDPTSNYKWGSFSNLPAIVSKECTGIGVTTGLDGGAVCYTCLLLRGKKVNSNLCTFPRSWNDCLQRSPERRGRSTLTSTYIEDASNCSYNNKNKLKDMVKKLLAEAASQEHYGSLMKNLSDKSQQSHS